MQGVIYSYTSPCGKVYIGQTLILQRKRIDKHKYEAITKHCNTPFGNAIRKYGWDEIKKSYTVLETVEADTKQELKAKLTDRENYYMETMNTFVPNGYNVKETNQRALGEYRNKELMYSKISKSLKGKYMNASSSSRKVIDMDTMIEYPSISEAARATGCLVQEICRVLKGKGLTARGKRFCYIGEDGKPDTSNLRNKNRKELPVYCPELGMHFISAYEAAKYIGKPNGKSNIRIACQSGKKRYGYTWIYENEHGNTVPSQQK